MADVDYAGVIAADFVDGLARAGTTTALVFGAHFAPAVDVLFERAAARRAARSPPGSSSATASCAPSSRSAPEQAHADGLAPRRALARQGTAALRRHPALLARHHAGAAGELRRPARRRRRRPVHLARQREPGRDRRGGAALPGVRALRRHLRPLRAARAAQRARAQRAPHRRRAGRAGGARGRASRTARRATARWAAACSRCAATSSAVCGWRWAPTSARAPASRCSGRGCRPTSCRRCSADGLPADVRAPALAGDAGRGGARWASDDVGDLSVGSQFDAVWVRPHRRQHARPGARPRRRRRRRVGQGLRPGRRPQIYAASWVAGVSVVDPVTLVIVERKQNFA